MSIIPVTVPTGAIRYNTDSNKMECFDGAKWWQVSVTYESTPTSGRAVRMGGQDSAPVNAQEEIEYVTISTRGNAVDFGNLSAARARNKACSSRTRGVSGGGDTSGAVNILEYITIASTGNAIDFGDLWDGSSKVCGFGNQVRGIFAGGDPSGAAYDDTIAYITIASTGNSSDFGNLTSARRHSSACATPTRGVITGGLTPSGQTNQMEYVTIQSTGNSVDFGDLTHTIDFHAACSNSTRGVSFGGVYPGGYMSTVQYWTMTTLGNASTFGDLFRGTTYGDTAAASSTRALMLGGHGSPGNENNKLNTIQFVEIQTLGDSVNFGDLTRASQWGAGLSNVHGGL